MDDASSSIQGPQNSQDKPKAAESWRPTRWRDRVLATSLWLVTLYLNTPLFQRFPPPEPLQPFFAAEYHMLRLACYVFLLALLAVWLRFRTFWFVIYFLLFPIVLTSLVVWWVASAVVRFTGWQVLILTLVSVCSATVRVIGSSKRAAVLALGVLPSCYIILAVGSNRYFLYPAVFILLLASVRIVWGTFQWVLKPLETLTWMVDRLLYHYNKGIKDETFNVDLSADPNSEKAKQVQRTMDTARTLVKGVRWVKSTLVTERSLLIMFLCVLMGALLLTTMSFGFLYYGLYKIDASHFVGSGQDTGFGQFCYFSFMVMSTSDLLPLKPATWLSRFTTVLQMFCSLALLSLLLLSFSTVGQANLSEANARLDKLVDDQEKKLAQWEVLLRKPPLELTKG